MQDVAIRPSVCGRDAAKYQRVGAKAVGHPCPEGNVTSVVAQGKKASMEKGILRAFRRNRPGCLGTAIHAPPARHRHDSAGALGVVPDGPETGPGGSTDAT